MRPCSISQAWPRRYTSSSRVCTLSRGSAERSDLALPDISSPFSVLIEAVLPEVGEAGQDRLRDRTARAADRLAAGLELHGHAHRYPGAAWPELMLLGHRLYPAPQGRAFGCDQGSDQRD